MRTLEQVDIDPTGYFVLKNRSGMITCSSFNKVKRDVIKELEKYELKPNSLMPSLMDHQVEWVEAEFQRINHFMKSRFGQSSVLQEVVRFVREPLELIDAKFFPSLKNYPEGWPDDRHMSLFTFIQFILETLGREALYNKLIQTGLYQAVLGFKEKGGRAFYLDPSKDYIISELEIAALETLSNTTAQSKTKRRL